MNILNRKLNNAITKLLRERCASGGAMTRVELAEALADEFGLDTSEKKDAFAMLVSAIVNMGAVPGYRAKRGRNGGVCRIGGEPEPEVESTTTSVE